MDRHTGSHPTETSRTDHYLIVIWGDVSAERLGPYPTTDARDEAAKAIRREEGDDHGIHTLEVTTTGNAPVGIEVGDYSGAFFDDEDTVEDA